MGSVGFAEGTWYANDAQVDSEDTEEEYVDAQMDWSAPLTAEPDLPLQGLLQRPHGDVPSHAAASHPNSNPAAVAELRRGPAESSPQAQRSTIPALKMSNFVQANVGDTCTICLNLLDLMDKVVRVRPDPRRSATGPSANAEGVVHSPASWAPGRGPIYCGHAFHERCIEAVCKTASIRGESPLCPICRSPFEEVITVPTAVRVVMPKHVSFGPAAEADLASVSLVEEAPEQVENVNLLVGWSAGEETYEVTRWVARRLVRSETRVSGYSI